MLYWRIRNEERVRGCYVTRVSTVESPRGMVGTRGTIQSSWNRQFIFLTNRYTTQSQASSWQLGSTQCGPTSPRVDPKSGLGHGEMAQWLRALVALAEDPGSVRSTHMMSHKCLLPVPGDLMPSSRLFWHRTCTWYIFCTCTYMQANISYIKHKRKINKSLKSILCVYVLVFFEPSP